MKKIDLQKVGFAVVLIVALGLSWWSLFELASNNYGLPWFLAAAVSFAYDGAALFVASLATKYAISEDSGAGARFATLLFVSTSAFLNVAHAMFLGLGFTGGLFFGAPPIIAGIVFELHLRYENRKSLRQRGRFVEPLPVFGKLTWLIFPSATYRVVKKVLSTRLMNHATSLDNNIAETDIFVKKKTNEDKVLNEARKIVDNPKALLGQKPDKVFKGLDKDSPTAQLVYRLMDHGYDKKDIIVQVIQTWTGKDVNPNTIDRYKARWRESKQVTSDID